MEEIWKSIPGFSKYESSNLGRIRSLNYKRSGKVVVLKPALSDGYFKTMIMDDTGKYKSWFVHKWIAFTFLGEKPEGLEINHKDGNKENNSAYNLEYVSRSENISHAYRFGLLKAKTGSSNGNSKLQSKDIIAIREHARIFAPNYGRKKLAEKYNVSEAHIKDIVTRRRDIWKIV